MNVVDSEQRANHVEAVDGARLIRRLCSDELATEIGMMDKGVRDDAARCRLQREVGLRFIKIVLA